MTLSGKDTIYPTTPGSNLKYVHGKTVEPANASDRLAREDDSSGEAIFYKLEIAVLTVCVTHKTMFRADLDKAPPTGGHLTCDGSECYCGESFRADLI